MLTGSSRILNSVALAILLLGGGGCKPRVKSDTPATSEAKPSKAGDIAATEETQYLTLTNDRDGTKFRVAIPAEPSVDFGPPDYSGDLDEDVGLSGYSSGVEAINKLATDASGGADAHDIFLAIMADHGGNRSGADAGYTDSGALLLAVWYQREHPGTKLVDAAEALKQNPPDIRKIKKAAHVAGLWIEAFNTGNYNYDGADAGPSAPMFTPKRGNAETVVDSDAVGTQRKLGGDRQSSIRDTADTALARATPAVRALLEKEAAANEECRGSSDQATIDRQCAIRDRLEAALDKAGWCYGRSDDTSAADSYWHDCKW